MRIANTSSRARNAGFALVAGLCLGIAGSANAAIVQFYGADNGVGPGDARPNSDAAAAAFDAAVNESIITFEGASLPNVAPGVSVTTSGLDGGGLVSGDQHSPSPLGFNTTSGGSSWLQAWPGFNSAGASFTFTFDNPISAFGAYFTDTQTGFPGAITVGFNDGSNQLLTFDKNDNTGGVLFFGFTDSGASILSITVATGATAGTRDIWGMDDVRFGAADNAVPLPAALPLFAGGLGVLGLIARRRKRQAV